MADEPANVSELQQELKELQIENKKLRKKNEAQQKIITKLKSYEESLRTSEERFRTILEETEEGYWENDLNGNFTFVNEPLCKIFGYSRAELLGMNNREYTTPETAARAYNIFNRVYYTGQTNHLRDYEITTKDGNIVVLEGSVSLMRDHAGKPIGFRGVCRDETERKLAEEMLRQSQYNLAYAQQVAKLGYYYWYLDTNEMLWSDEMYNLFGIDKVTFDLRTDTFIQLLHPDDLPLFSEENIARLVEVEIHEMTFRIFDNKTNALKHMYLWGETSFDDRQQPQTVFGIIQDISDRREAEIQLEAYAAELERSNRELQRFAYVASHDLQEPLRKIQLFGDRLIQKYQPLLDERGQNYIHRMQNAAERLQTLIVDLLTISRLRTQAPWFRQVALNQIMSEVVQNFDIAIAEAGADVVMAELPIIEADSQQMYQLFQNLLSNALKFKQAEVPLKIVVLCQVIDGICEISIIDNGIGIEEKYLERIFVVFERLHDRNTYPGTGIGLAICRGIVERHNGTIQVSSKPGEEAAFIVKLPLKQT